MRNNKKFHLFTNCKIVKGASRLILCDLQKGNFIYLSDGLLEILTDHKSKTIGDILNIYDEENESVINEYFDFLVVCDYGFLYQTGQNPETEFPEMNTQFDAPHKISDAILDINKGSNHDYRLIFSELSVLGTKNLQIRCFDSMQFSEITDILDKTRNLRFKYIHLIIKHNASVAEFYGTLSMNYPAIGLVTIHSAPVVKEIKLGTQRFYEFIPQVIESELCCGRVSSSGFTVTSDHFFESANFNTCLNKKISIDKNGYIRNCPSMKQHYGKFPDNSMLDIAFSKEFTNIWNIHKDKIKVCKDCQFRYICTDCRAYLDDNYDKPKYCKYDPYLDTWEK